MPPRRRVPHRQPSVNVVGLLEGVRPQWRRGIDRPAVDGAQQGLVCLFLLVAVTKVLIEPSRQESRQSRAGVVTDDGHDAVTVQLGIQAGRQHLRFGTNAAGATVRLECVRLRDDGYDSVVEVCGPLHEQGEISPERYVPAVKADINAV
jgi:hypothetical protein